MMKDMRVFPQLEKGFTNVHYLTQTREEGPQQRYQTIDEAQRESEKEMSQVFASVQTGRIWTIESTSGAETNLGATRTQVLKEVMQVDKLTEIPRRKTGSPEKSFGKTQRCTHTKESEKDAGRGRQGGSTENQEQLKEGR
jgi:hypothetical protein